jgi:UDP-GlcNAc:undecaprenyl-phosphate GlcNAc-1-phosphate transferase
MYSFDSGYSSMPWWLFPASMVFFFWLAWLLKRWISRFGTTRKSLDTASRWSKSQKPTLGGILFAAALCFSLFSHVLMPGFAFTVTTLAFYAGAFLAFAIGMLDDVSRMSALRKFGLQWVAAGIFVAALWGHYPPWLLLLLMGWIVVVMNSLNMFDNMDGVAASASLVAICGLFMMGQGWPLTLFLTAALLIFLRFNWPVSSMFMGDSGSHLLGYVLALLPFLKHLQTKPANASAWMPPDPVSSYNAFMLNPVLDIIMLATLLSVPLSDTAIVTINRLLAGRSPARGGRDHTTHNLAYCGMKGWMICVVIMVVGITGCWLNYRAGELFRAEVVNTVSAQGYFDTWHFVDTLRICTPNLVLIGVTFIILFVITRINLKKGKYSYLP